MADFSKGEDYRNTFNLVIEQGAMAYSDKDQNSYYGMKTGEATYTDEETGNL